MVIDTLQNIACHTCIKKSDGQVHEFDEKVGHQGDIDTCTQMQQNPTADNLNGRSTNKKCQLRKKN